MDEPALLIDAASPRLCVGLYGKAALGSGAHWRETDEETGVGLFRETEELLRAAGMTIRDLRAVVFCDGPGSLLGIRIAAMALRVWQALPRPQPLRVLAYHSLALVAADRLAQGEAPPFHVCSDARRETWNLLTVSVDGALGEIRRCARGDLPANGRPLFVPETFPHWQPLPGGARRIAYQPRLLPELAARFPLLLRETTAPDAFMTEMPTYRTWNPS
jgi:tRNA threonylcarbamoyladenosine biosynthesis protein TsaB